MAIPRMGVSMTLPISRNGDLSRRKKKRKEEANREKRLEKRIFSFDPDPDLLEKVGIAFNWMDMNSHACLEDHLLSSSQDDMTAICFDEIGLSRK